MIPWRNPLRFQIESFLLRVACFFLQIRSIDIRSQKNSKSMPETAYQFPHGYMTAPLSSPRVCFKCFKWTSVCWCFNNALLWCCKIGFKLIKHNRRCPGCGEYFRLKWILSLSRFVVHQILCASLLHYFFMCL